MVDLVVVAGKGDKFSSSGCRDAKAEKKKHTMTRSRWKQNWVVMLDLTVDHHGHGG